MLGSVNYKRIVSFYRKFYQKRLYVALFYLFKDACVILGKRLILPTNEPIFFWQKGCSKNLCIVLSKF